MAVPAFTKIARKSRVQQTAETLVAALNTALQLSKQQARLEPVVVYFGDDFSNVKTKPYGYVNAQLPGVLPKYGNIEIWTAKCCGCADSYGWMAPYEAPPAYWPGEGWVPWYTPQEPLISDLLTFPDGVRIIAGYCASWVPYGEGEAGRKYSFQFRNFKRDNAIGEVKRHCIAVNNGTGSTVSAYSFEDVLVFDVLTGEHLVIRATGNMFGDTCMSFQDPKARIMTVPATREYAQIYAIEKPSSGAFAIYGTWETAYLTPDRTNNYSKYDKKLIQSRIDD
jgi:hypothetical protein